MMRLAVQLSAFKALCVPSCRLLVNSHRILDLSLLLRPKFVHSRAKQAKSGLVLYEVSSGNNAVQRAWNGRRLTSYISGLLAYSRP